LLKCKKNKAIQTIAELDSKDGIGLIEKKRQGQGRPTRIYVKSFYIPKDKLENHNSEVGKTNFLKFEKSTSGCLENQPLEVGISNPNKNIITNTDFNEIKSNLIGQQKALPCDIDKNRIRMNEYADLIKKNIEYEFLFDKSKRFVIKTDDKYPMHSIHKTFSFLKVLFPSSLKIEYFVDGIYNENNFVTTYYHNTDLNDSSKDDYLHFDELKIPLINDFIVNTFSDFYKIGYIENSIKNYIGSFDASHKHFRFLSLCICLECLINETSELLYRISRGCSIICGEDKEKAKELRF